MGTTSWPTFTVPTYHDIDCWSRWSSCTVTLTEAVGCEFSNRNFSLSWGFYISYQLGCICFHFCSPFENSSNLFLQTMQYILCTSLENSPQTNPIIGRIECKAGHGAGRPTQKTVIIALNFGSYTSPLSAAINIWLLFHRSMKLLIGMASWQGCWALLGMSTIRFKWRRIYIQLLENIHWNRMILFPIVWVSFPKLNLTTVDLQSRKQAIQNL